MEQAATQGSVAFAKLEQLKNRVVNAGCELDVSTVVRAGTLMAPAHCCLNRAEAETRRRSMFRRMSPNLVQPRVSDLFQVHSYLVDRSYRSAEANEGVPSPAPAPPKKRRRDSLPIDNVEPFPVFSSAVGRGLVDCFSQLQSAAKDARTDNKRFSRPFIELAIKLSFFTTDRCSVHDLVT